MEPKAVMTITGTSASAARAARSTSKPEPFGMRRSVRTRRWRESAISFRAARASFASATLYPAFSRVSRITPRSLSLSSTSRISATGVHDRFLLRRVSRDTSYRSYRTYGIRFLTLSPNVTGRRAHSLTASRNCTILGAFRNGTVVADSGADELSGLPEDSLAEVDAQMKSRRVKQQKGFTMMQMVITIAIIAVVSTFGVMGIRNARAEFRKQSSARLFASYIEKARADSVRRHAASGTEASVETFGAGTSTYAVTMDFGTGTVETRTF